MPPCYDRRCTPASCVAVAEKVLNGHPMAASGLFGHCALASGRLAGLVTGFILMDTLHERHATKARLRGVRVKGKQIPSTATRGQAIPASLLE